MFKKIIYSIYGLLIDYQTNTANIVHKMIVNYNNKDKTICEVDDTDLNIKVALKHVTLIMDKTVATFLFLCHHYYMVISHAMS